MANQFITLPVNPADSGGPTLSGGARYAALGGGLPARVTTQADVLIDDVMGSYGNPVFDPDNTHIWCPSFEAGALRRYVITTGAQNLSTATVAQCMGLMRNGATSMFLGGYTDNSLKEYGWDGVLIRSVASPSANPRAFFAVPGVSGLVWVQRFASDLLKEATWPAGVLTGKQTANGVGSAYPSPNGTYLYVILNATTIRKYRESDVATMYSVTPQQHGDCMHGHVSASGQINQLYIGADDKPVVSYNFYSHIDRFLNQSGSTLAAIADKRIVWGDPTFGGSAARQAVLGPPLGFSDDGNYAWIRSPKLAAEGLATSIRIVRVSTHRARWAQAFAANATLKYIFVPGALGNNYSANATYDNRRTRCYYSLDGGDNRTEFTPGSLLDVSITAGQTLTVDADMNIWEKPALDAPYVGGDAGEGPTIVYDDLLSGGGAQRTKFNNGFN